MENSEKAFSQIKRHSDSLMPLSFSYRIPVLDLHRQYQPYNGYVSGKIVPHLQSSRQHPAVDTAFDANAVGCQCSRSSNFECSDRGLVIWGM